MDKWSNIRLSLVAFVLFGHEAVKGVNETIDEICSAITPSHPHLGVFLVDVTFGNVNVEYFCELGDDFLRAHIGSEAFGYLEGIADFYQGCLLCRPVQTDTVYRFLIAKGSEVNLFECTERFAEKLQ